jgi:hypothetical protein
MHDPHAARVSVRLAQYPNHEVERRSIQSVDEQVFDRVRAYEQLMVQGARAFEERTTQVRRDAADVAVELADMTREIESGELELNGETAERWDKLRLRAEQAAKRLRSTLAESRFHAARTADPYGQFVSLIRRYPALGREIRP